MITICNPRNIPDGHEDLLGLDVDVEGEGDVLLGLGALQISNCYLQQFRLSGGRLTI